MASFTDAISTFNPYISQLPIVEEMSKVGMERQAKYDQGVQKIQGQIDNVAGMDIMKGDHKVYLESQLNKLGSDLRTVAASDFSNFQLVNSVGGMATQIIKDPVIQNAVYSTKVARKGQSEMESARKAGKSSIQNEQWYNDQLTGWLNDKDVNSTFSGKFTEYTDMYDKLSKVAKDVQEVEHSYDMPYKTNPDGSLKYFTTDKKGNVIETTEGKGQIAVDDAMKRISTKGKTAQTILNNFYDSLSENDLQQLRIDAKYHYKNMSPEALTKIVANTNNLEKKQLEQYSTYLSVALHSPKLNDVEKAKMQAKLKDVNDKLSGDYFEKSINNSLEQLKNPQNLEEFKYKLYTQNTLTNLAQDKSTESYNESLLSNPYAQMAQEKKRFQFDVNKENTRINQWHTDHQWDIYKYTHLSAKEQYDVQQKELEKLGEMPITETAAKSTEDIDKPTMTTISNSIDQGNEDRKRLTASYIGELNLSQEDARRKADELDELAAKYDQDPGSVDVTDNKLRKYLDERRTIDLDVMHNGNLQKGAIAVGAKYDKALDDILNQYSGVVDTNGKTLYTAKDLYTVDNIAKNYYVTMPGGGGKYPSVGKTTFDDAKFLARFAGTKLEAVAKIYLKNINDPKVFGSLNPNDKIIYDKSRQLAQAVGPTAANLLKQQLAAQSNYLFKKMPEYMETFGALDKNNKIDMARVDGLITRKIDLYNRTGALDVENKGDFDPETLNKWQQEAKTGKTILGFVLHKNYDGSGSLIVQNGKDEQVVPLTASQFSSDFPRYARLNFTDQIKSRILASPDATTNMNKLKDPVNAAFTGQSLPLLKGTKYESLVRYDVEGTNDATGAPTDDYQIRVYVYDDKQKVWKNDVVNQTGYMRENALSSSIQGIGLDIVNRIKNK